VAPGGEVVLSDVVTEMTTIAAARARALGRTNVSTRVLDIEAIDRPDRSFDVVLCREGLMFALDPARACAEIRRVLVPGGRVGIAVWGPCERNPWLGIVLDAMSAQVGAPMPPPGIPGPFALDDAERLAELLTGAGLRDVEVDELPMPLHAGSFDEWWARTVALAGPLANVLASLPSAAAGALRSRAREAVRPYETEDGLDLPGVTLIAQGCRPWTTG
jgi:SAM-dependent methyltransferase